MPSMLRHRSCVSPVLKHFYHQGPKALEHGPRWVLSSSLLIQHFQHVKQTTYGPNHSMPSMLRHKNCVSPVLKHFYHQGPKALEHGPRWVLSSSLLIQHFQHVKQTTYSPNHYMPSMLRHRSCVSPVLKHFYHQGPKALEHGPRWVLSSSLLIQHFQHVKQTTYGPNHSMPSMLRHKNCVSPVLKHFHHQGPKALEHGPRWVLSSSLLIQHFQHVKQTTYSPNHSMPSMLRHRSCVSPVLKHFYHQGPKALEHGPRWVLSSSLLIQHFQHVKQTTYSPNHSMPSMLRHRSCVSPVLKHFYHQGPKALEHGPRWVLSSSLLIQHFQHVKQTTYSPNHSMPSMLRHRSCVSPDLKHFYHQGPKALEHGPRWVLSSSLLIQHFQHVKQTTYGPNHSMPSMLRHKNCVSPVLKHFYHQGPEALEHGPRWVLSSSLLIQHFQHVKQTTCGPNHSMPSMLCHRSCVSPVLKHFYHQGPKALEHGPRWVLSSSLLIQHFQHVKQTTYSPNHSMPSMLRHRSRVSPVLKHFYHQGPKALEHGPRWVLSSSLLIQHFQHVKQTTYSPNHSQPKPLYTKHAAS